MIRPKHPARDAVRETNERKQCRPTAKSSGQCIQLQTPRGRQRMKAHAHTHTHRKMIWPWRPVVQSARRQTSGRQVKIRRAEGIIDQAEASGTAIISETHQGIQQSNHLEDILKEMNATFGKMIRPSHPAKQPCGRHMTRNACKPLAK